MSTDPAHDTSAARTALVMGANGRVGSAVVHAFAAAGWRVLAQARRQPTALPPGAVHIANDLADTAGLAAAAHGARVVIDAINPVYTRWQQDSLSFMRRSLALAGRIGATYVLPGNVYPFGAAMPAVLGAHTPHDASTRKGRIRVQLEAELQAAARQGQRCVVLRAGDFFGYGSGSWLDLVVVKSLRRGKLVYPGPLDVPHPWAYLPDLAHAFVAVAARAHQLPAFIDLPFAGHTLTGRQLLDAIERAALALGVAPAQGLRRGSFPWPLLKAARWLVPMWREVSEMSYLWHVPHALDGTLLERTVGPLPATPLDAALRESLRRLGHGRVDADTSHPAPALK
ncbi:MAG: NmrA family NAD(P)-binding protein [Ideonella sp.]|nr:NmrA family NAD(P)-binding protein [Ideonella sp.]MCC7456308.1 NmrA family NAD(P)-binding protein [Nitrospira sp.]